MNPDEQVLQYHIRIGHDVPLGKYCLLPGDPGRCAAIAAHFDDPVHQTTNREYCTWTGTLLGQPVSVCSTGIGGPSSAIAIEELFALGADTFIRVGTCGGIDLKVRAGDLVIATGAVRQDGTSHEYAPPEYPAVADFSVTQALVWAAEEAGCRFHTGVVQSKDSFYGQHSPERMPIARQLLDRWEAYRRLGVLCSEMESAAQFVVSDSLGARCGGGFTYTAQGIKDCSACLFPHRQENYDAICARFSELSALAEKKRK